MGVGLGGMDSSSLASSASNSASFRMRYFFLLCHHLFVSPLNVHLFLGLRESRCWSSILGTAMPDSSKLAMAMALLMRWPMNNDEEEENELNYAPLPHLSSFLLLSPSSLPWSSFSCPASSPLPTMAAAAALSFPRGLPLPALPWAAARAP
jgi:hypothetical protein